MPRSQQVLGRWYYFTQVFVGRSACLRVLRDWQRVHSIVDEVRDARRETPRNSRDNFAYDRPCYWDCYYAVRLSSRRSGPVTAMGVGVSDEAMGAGPVVVAVVGVAWLGVAACSS